MLISRKERCSGFRCDKKLRSETANGSREITGSSHPTGKTKEGKKEDIRNIAFE